MVLRTRLIQPHPAALELEYARQMRRLVRDLLGAYLRRFAEAAPIGSGLQSLRGDEDDRSREHGWAQRLEAAGLVGDADVDGLIALARRLLRSFGQRVSAFHLRGWQRLLKRAYKVVVIKPESWLQEDLNAWEATNVSLIRSVAMQGKAQMMGVFQRAVREARSLRDVKRDLAQTFRLSGKRAELIARDQIGKLNGQLTQERQQDIGVTSYVWQTSHDERVRPLHRQYDGTVYRWDRPPADGHPGQAIRCRCFASPVLPDLADLQGLAISSG